MKNLLMKFLPLERMISLAMRFGLLRKPLELAARLYLKMAGARTEAAIALAAATLLLAFLGILPWDQAAAFATFLAGHAAPTFAAKLERILPEIKKAASAVEEEAKKA